MVVNNVYKQPSSVSPAFLFRHLKACLTCQSCPLAVRIFTWFTLFLLALHILVLVHLPLSDHDAIRQQEIRMRSERVHPAKDRPPLIVDTIDESPWTERVKVVEDYRDKLLHQQAIEEATKQCPYKSLKELTEDQKQPVANGRHMVAPPKGGKIHLVCCQTTKGTLSIVAHERWAPLGTQRFLEMVTLGYFNAGVPMMRCVKDFLCQFGLSASPERKRDFDATIPDDPNWLPEGPTRRENALGVKRFAEGYLAYAGGGKNSRNKQLIVALKANGPLAGGSPWEVPWGELVGDESFQTLSQIYTGYGEDGPKQGMLHNNGMTEEMKLDFPQLDYITHCEVLDEHDYGDA
jgi:cyclophilin family peptidyl-prolyl cis-trans isomerase